MNLTARTVLEALALMLGMLALEYTGIRLGRRRLAKIGERKPRGYVVETAVFSILGLMVAFSFYGATGRFDELRKMVKDEVNATSTAYMRLDLLPAAAQPALKATFRDYVQSRVDVYRAPPDKWEEPATASRLLREKIWDLAVEACREGCSASRESLVYGSLGDMFDYATSQWLTSRMHPPKVVFVMLFGLSLLGALLVGKDLTEIGRRSWVYLLAYPITLAITIWVVLDVEFPRQGVTRIDDFDDVFVTMHSRMP